MAFDQKPTNDGSQSPRTQAQDTYWIKMCLKFIGILYVAYVVFHILVAGGKGCNVDMTLMTMFPIRELYTIPRFDQVFMDAFMQPDTNPATGIAAAVGWGIKGVAANILTTPDACQLLDSLRF